VYGIQVPVQIRSLKQRLKEEIQIVTATRRLHLDEMEEIRRMERELEEREKERRIKAETEAKKRADAEARAKAEEAKQARRKMTPPAQTLTSRMSPQASPRRGRHKRQNSDPIIAKFSPIEEHKDIEAEMYNRLGLETATLASDLANSLNAQTLRYNRRLGTITPPVHSDLADFPPISAMRFGRPLRGHLSRSSETLAYTEMPSMAFQRRLTPSQSETSLPLTMMQRSRSPMFFDDDDERGMRIKEEKRQQLQLEIKKRRKQLEENARLQYELRKIRETGDITKQDFDQIKARYNQYIQARERLVQSSENIPTGIIRPIDYDFPELGEQYSKQEYLMYRELLERGGGLGRERYFPQPSYSSTEYLAFSSNCFLLFLISN